MATKRVDFVVSEKGTAKTKAGLKGVDKQLLSMAKSAISVGVAMAAIRKAAELTKLAADATNVERAFRNLSKEPDKMLAAMKKAVGGTIAEFELMKQFNTAALLGLPLDRFDEMLGVARGAAQATGQSMEYMLNSIVTGVGRGSKMILDNLGLMISLEDSYKKFADQQRINVKALTDQEKKQALLNEVLKQGKDNLEKIGGAAEGAFDNVDELTALIKDKSVKTFKDMVPAANLAAQAIIDFFDVLSFKEPALTVEQRLEGLNALMKNRFTLTVAELNEQFMRLGLGAFDASNGLYEFDRVQAELNETMERANAHLDMNSEGQMNSTAAVREHTEALKSLMMQQIDTSDSGNDLRTDFQKAEDQIDSFTRSMVRAAVEGQSMKDALISAARGLTIDLISEFIKRQLAAQFGNTAILASNAATATALGTAWATPAALASIATLGGASAVGSASLAASVASAHAIAAFAEGADFTTSGPQIMLVGEAGREHVSVTPLEGPNINGPQGGNTFIFNGDIIGTDDYIENNLIPAVNIAITQGRAALA